MNVIINEIVSRVRALDGESILAPQTMATIVRAVLQATQAREDHDQRISEEHTLDNYQRYRSRRRGN